MQTLSPERLQTLLAEKDANYNAELHLLRGPMYGAGYHTTLKAGAPVHLPRESASYALLLLAAGQGERASDILRAICQLQDQDPANKTCGIWSWTYEEPLEKMSPPDWNWADFIGSSIATALCAYTDLLDPDTQKQLERALRFAAEAIERRNVGPGYTNIAILGGGVCALAGELLQRDDLLAYGRKRLQGCVSHRSEHGSFNEYNSPTYTMVVVDETERFLALVKDEETREAARALNEHAWEVIATHFHSPTRQWAGPHARTYADVLSKETLARLSLRVGHNLLASEEELAENLPFLATEPRPCPERWRAHFVETPQGETSVRLQVSAAGDGRDEPRVATTWFKGDACMGSINYDMMWTQRRGVLAYTKTAAGATGVFRLRFMHGEHDFSSGWLETVQEGPRITAKIGVVDGRGDFHPSLDKPTDGFFKGGGWSIRLELAAANATLSEEPRALVAAPYAIRIDTAEGNLAGHALDWSFEQEGEVVALVGRAGGIGDDGLAYEQLKETAVSLCFELVDWSVASR